MSRIRRHQVCGHRPEFHTLIAPFGEGRRHSRLKLLLGVGEPGVQVSCGLFDRFQDIVDARLEDAFQAEFDHGPEFGVAQATPGNRVGADGVGPEGPGTAGPGRPHVCLRWVWSTAPSSTPWWSESHLQGPGWLAMEVLRASWTERPAGLEELSVATGRFFNFFCFSLGGGGMSGFSSRYSFVYTTSLAEAGGLAGGVAWPVPASLFFSIGKGGWAFFLTGWKFVEAGCKCWRAGFG